VDGHFLKKASAKYANVHLENCVKEQINAGSCHQMKILYYSKKPRY
jgi:hypothetical protein